jgi:flagellin
MPLVINHNIMAMATSRNLAHAYSQMALSTKRLSSGQRVMSSSDDAASLAIRTLMRTDITSLNQGVRNANDAVSLIQTADGALGVIDEKLIRMKELAMQASTGTYSSDQRLIIDSEYQAMASEITRIAKATDFNGIHLLNGNLSGDVHNGSGLNATGKLKVHFGSGNDSAEDYYYLQINSATASALGLSGGGVTKASLIAKHGLTSELDTTLGALTWWSTAPASVQSQFDSSVTVEVYTSPTELRDYAFATDRNGQKRALWGYSSDGHTVDTYGGMETLGEGSGGGSISTQELAQQALNSVNKAIVSKDSIRASLGAMQNRLVNTIDNLQNQTLRLQAAESQISDVDVSTEMTAFTRNQIVSQAAVAMLSQANSLSKLALQLISG